MITMEMAGMASRLTEQARRDAGAKIDRWRGAIEGVRQAEKQADMTINLPTHLTAAANRAASAIHTADYVSAVGMAQQAVEARQQVLEIATNAVTQEVSERSLFLSNATRKLESVQESHSSRMRDYNNPILPESPNTVALAKAGLGIGVCIFIFQLVIGPSLKVPIPDVMRVPLVILLLAFTLFGWATIPLLAWLIYGINVVQVERKSSRKGDTAEADHQMKTPGLSGEIDRAKQQLNKIENAQRLLQTL